VRGVICLLESLKPNGNDTWGGSWRKYTNQGVVAPTLGRACRDVSKDTVKLDNRVKILAKDGHFNTTMCWASCRYKAVNLRESK